MKTSVYIPAAGSGKRFGSPLPKQFVLLNGLPLIIHTISLFHGMPETESIIIPVNTEWHDYLSEMLDEYNLSDSVTLVEGGAERQDSVFNALGHTIHLESEVILIHDAVRPFATTELVRQVIDSALQFGAAIPGLMPKETIKQAGPDGFVSSTLNRSGLVSVQTPQGFRKDLIVEAYRVARQDGITATDDASLAEYAGFPVRIIPGLDSNIKITTPLDFNFAGFILNMNKEN
jgi:2-C-methyl-D-erythritol 4-phosphate cytidylyltransferase